MAKQGLGNNSNSLSIKPSSSVNKLSESESALVDLLQDSKCPNLLDLKKWDSFQLVSYLYHQQIILPIIFRSYTGKVNGNIFYGLGHRDPNENGNTPRWSYYTKTGINDYLEISKLTRVIEKYERVCFTDS